jgi:hypothetical protein
VSSPLENQTNRVCTPEQAAVLLQSMVDGMNWLRANNYVDHYAAFMKFACIPARPSE